MSIKRLAFSPSGTKDIGGAGAPRSGTYGAGYRTSGKGSTYTDTTNGVLWVNEGTAAAPYWSPLSVNQAGLWGVDSDFREIPATALTDTAVAYFHASGVRVFGQGLAETDSGALANAAGEGGYTLRMTTTDEVAHTIAIGTAAGIYQPDQHGFAYVEAEVAHVTGITLRGLGIGFVGTAADAFDPPITAATTVATLVQDDLALLHFNVGYTATDKYLLASNKSDAAATMTAQVTGVTVSAAAVYDRLRVELEPFGTTVIMRAFVNKVLVGTIADALDEDEEASPILYLESTSAAIKAMDVRRFRFVAHRP